MINKFLKINSMTRLWKNMLLPRKMVAPSYVVTPFKLMIQIRFNKLESQIFI